MKLQSNEQMDKFYKLHISLNVPEHNGYFGAAVFSEFLFMIIAAVPFQEVFKETDDEGFLIILGVMLGWWAALFYISSYVKFREKGKNCTITGKLKYLPVDPRELKKARVIYLIKFVSVCLCIAFFVQMITSVSTYHDIIWQNICYIVLLAFVWPIASNLPYVLN